MEKKMKKIVIALGILLCLVVVSVMAALPATARAPMFAGDVPCAWLPDEGDPSEIDPTKVNFSRTVFGAGYENRYTTIATQRGANGINARLTARGSGDIWEDREEIYIDTWNSSPELTIDSFVDKYYGNITLNDGTYTLKPKDELLRGMICTRNYEAGVAVSERYLNTYAREGTLTHEGDGSRSSTLIDMTTYGTTRLGITVKDPEDKTHTVLWSRDEHTGLFTRNINITVQRYLAP